MIINHIRAENVLKYRLLDVSDVAERGLIGISGPNESGKSSIGEAICFALFGRTFSLAPEDIGKIIRWGEERCSVWLQISVKGRDYEVARFLDRDGNHSARLTDMADRENPIARGAKGVAAAMIEVLGYDFGEFIESFYLAQREITAPHPHSYAVKMMAGVAPLETCVASLKDEVMQEQAAVESFGTKVTDLDDQLAELGLEQGHLEALERERRAVTEREQERLAEIRGLKEAGANYRTRLAEWQLARSRRSSAALLRFLLMLLGLLLGVGWGLLMFAADSKAGQWLIGTLGLQPHAGDEVYMTWILSGAVVAVLLGAAAWYRRAGLDARVKKLVAGNEELTIRLEELDEIPAEGMAPRVALDVDEGSEGRALGPSTPPDPEHRARLRERISQMDASLEEVQQGIDRETSWLQQAAGALGREREELERAVAEERRRIEQHNKLVSMREAFSDQIEDHRHRIAVRQLGEELLLRASRQISHRFNHNLRGLVSHTLPLFTEGHYEHLQIGDDLDVRVFSAEKQDFMELEEVSSGTQRQIMLALRLALSQQLIDRVIQDSQFVFLDEPFAFFDERRTRSSLSVLPRLSDDVRQIWVVAQQFPEDVAMELKISCDRDSNRLQAVGS